jgi:serine acetyltransferase
VNPGAIVSGECRIGPETLLGAGSVVLQGLT